jgi:hypothetical protein
MLASGWYMFEKQKAALFGKLQHSSFQADLALLLHTAYAVDRVAAGAQHSQAMDPDGFKLSCKLFQTYRYGIQHNVGVTEYLTSGSLVATYTFIEELLKLPTSLPALRLKLQEPDSPLAAILRKPYYKTGE